MESRYVTVSPRTTWPTGAAVFTASRWSALCSLTTWRRSPWAGRPRRPADASAGAAAAVDAFGASGVGAGWYRLTGGRPSLEPDAGAAGVAGATGGAAATGGGAGGAATGAAGAAVSAAGEGRRPPPAGC